MNIQKVLSGIMILCGIGIIVVVGLAMANGTDMVDNLKTGGIGLGMILFGFIFYFKKTQK